MDGRIAAIMVFCFIFLGSFVALLGLIPSDFAVASKEYSSLAEQVPDYWNGVNLMQYNLTDAWNYTLTYPTSTPVDFDTGGRNLKLVIDAITAPYVLGLDHMYGWNLLWAEAMDWYNRNGVLKSYQEAGFARISTNEIDEDYEDNGDMQFTVKCLGLGQGSSTFQVMVFFSFNTTTYDTPSAAWFNDDLQILVGITLDNTNSALDAWALITGLLTFNTVEVFGNSGPEALAMNVILALPFWACIAIVAAVFLFEVLPF